MHYTCFRHKDTLRENTIRNTIQLSKSYCIFAIFKRSHDCRAGRRRRLASQNPKTIQKKNIIIIHPFTVILCLCRMVTYRSVGNYIVSTTNQKPINCRNINTTPFAKAVWVRLYMCREDNAKLCDRGRTVIIDTTTS